MDAWEKLPLLAGNADLDQDGELAPHSAERRAGREGTRPANELPLYYAAVGGRRVPILKTLLTSACERDCAYCPFRAGRDGRRLSFRPEEFAALADSVCRRGVAHGLLLSSGIAGGSVSTQDRLLATARLLREKHGFRGYLHLKLMPGAEKDQVLEAMRWADRVSVNLEAPGERFLGRLAPHKQFWNELFHTLHEAAEIRRTRDSRDFGRFRWPSLVTQFVVGAAGEKDRDLLNWSQRLLREMRLARVYFSTFRPIADTPLAEHPAESPARARRLYRAFFLLRDYSFSVDELSWDAEGNLKPGDPKVNWAERHLAESPVEINTASREELLRIPGIGAVRSKTLLRARRQGCLRDLGQLRALGLPAERMAPYILLDGKRPAYQRKLF